MRAPISVIIPTRNAEGALKPCLEALMEGLDAGLIRELIVVDGGSTDATGAIAQAWGATVLDVSPSRGGQLRQGCSAAVGEWLLILHSDTLLAPGWSKAVRLHMETGKAGWFQLTFDEGGVPGRLVASWANFRSRLGLPYGDQGMLLPRALYERVGGYPDQPVMEDVALARALRGQIVGIPCRATTRAAKYRDQGWVTCGTRSLWTLARYLMGVPATRLVRKEQASQKSLG